MERKAGIGAASGIAGGVVRRSCKQSIIIEKRYTDDIDSEITRLDDARSDYRRYLEELINKEENEDGRAILEAYREVAQDESFFDGVKERCRCEKVNIEYALQVEMESIVEQFLVMDDEYLSERANDIKNICDAITARIVGISDNEVLAPDENGRKLIVFAEDLTPDATLHMDRNLLGGFVTEKGGLTSHTVILAKTLGIPAVVGVAGALEGIADGQKAIIYGDKGEVIIEPDADELEKFKRELKIENKKKDEYKKALLGAAVTEDGIPVEVAVNMGDKSIDDYDILKKCDGIGLYRTEFIYIQSQDYPSEDVQLKYYRKVAEEAEGRPVVIRTLDIGGDKQASYMNMPKEENPFLGYRAIRMCLGNKDIFLTQLRAILQAGAYGNVEIMFPMISCMEELREAKSILDIARQQLIDEGKKFDNDIKVGIMVETPAAVQLCDLLAREVDFFSIGTNDLTQYITAADRMNSNVQYLNNTCSIAVLRSINHICECGEANNIKVAMCGEAASNPLLIPVWIAMGLTELSVVPGQVAQTKYIVNKVNKQKIRVQLSDLLNMDTIEKVNAKLSEMQCLIDID